MKRFKSRKRKRIKIKLLIIILLFVSSIYYFYYFINNKNNIINNKLFIKYALGINISDNNYKVISISNKEEPLIYIYNTHQLEEYTSNYLEAYNIVPTVMFASRILKDNLSNKDINSIIESEDLVKVRKNMNLSYSKSYQVSRMYLEKRSSEYGSLKYFIDIHRDSGYFVVDKYAKVLFVIGLDNPSYIDNYNFSNYLCIKLNGYINNLCRGVVKKSGKGVNGIYNQDFNKHTILIEVGGNLNNIGEVNNTLDILSNVLKEYIEEYNEEE